MMPSTLLLSHPSTFSKVFPMQILCTIQIKLEYDNYEKVGIWKEAAWNNSKEKFLHSHGQNLEYYQLISRQPLIEPTSEVHLASHRVQILGKPILSVCVCVCENGNILKIQVLAELKEYVRTRAAVPSPQYETTLRNFSKLHLILSSCDNYPVRSAKPGHLNVTLWPNENPLLTIVTP